MIREIEEGRSANILYIERYYLVSQCEIIKFNEPYNEPK